MKPFRVIPPAHSLSGKIVVPGSKSLTNRALLLAAMCEGTCTLSNALKSDDTRYMAEAIRQMGGEVSEPDDTTFVVSTSGKLSASAEPLYLGNAGTAMRFLTAFVTTLEGTTVLDGNEYIRKRPIGALVEALKAAGADISDTDGCPPVTVNGPARWTTDGFTVDATLSSQYVSALLMLSPLCGREIRVDTTTADIGAKGYIDLTISCMKDFGVDVEKTDRGLVIRPAPYVARDVAIEVDASTATYVWAANALTGGHIDMGIDPAKSSQPDADSYPVIMSFPNMPEKIDGSQMQDAVPTLAVVAALTNKDILFEGVGNLRVKECDRIEAVCKGLNAIKPGLATEYKDSFVVHGDPELVSNTSDVYIDTYDDHRIAMAFGTLGLRVPNLYIQEPECVSKTFPGFWDMLRGLGVEVDEE